MRLRLGVALKTLARLVKKFGRHRQITLSGRHVDVTEIGCQLWQQPLNIGALTVPGDEVVHGHRRKRGQTTILTLV